MIKKHTMPTIETIDGIKILLYSNDHVPPHFHVWYGEYRAMIDIQTLKIIKGELPNKALSKVIEWAENNQADLLENFYELNPHLRK
jgi:hypothetical protein